MDCNPSAKVSVLFVFIFFMTYKMVKKPLNMKTEYILLSTSAYSAQQTAITNDTALQQNQLCTNCTTEPNRSLCWQ